MSASFPYVLNSIINDYIIHYYKPPRETDALVNVEWFSQHELAIPNIHDRDWLFLHLDDQSHLKWNSFL